MAAIKRRKVNCDAEIAYGLNVCVCVFLHARTTNNKLSHNLTQIRGNKMKIVISINLHAIDGIYKYIWTIEWGNFESKKSKKKKKSIDRDAKISQNEIAARNVHFMDKNTYVIGF